MCSDSVAPGPSADTADHASHRGSPAYIKCWPGSRHPAEHTHLGVCWNTLQGQRVSAILACSLCQTSDHQYLLNRCKYMGLVPLFLWLPPRGLPLECLALEARGLVFLGLWNYDIWRDSSWQTTTLREPDSKLRHTPSLSKKGAICLSGSFGLRGRIPVWPT